MKKRSWAKRRQSARVESDASNRKIKPRECLTGSFERRHSDVHTLFFLYWIIIGTVGCYDRNKVDAVIVLGNLERH